MNTVNTYPITNEAKIKEPNNIQAMFSNNECNRNLSTSHYKNHKHTNNTSPQHPTTKWVIFTYYRKETKEITRLFKETNKKIAFKQNIQKKT
jgi:hypothetical protein